MNQHRLNRLFGDAYAWMRRERPVDLRWARKISKRTFRNLKATTFLREYVWVVYAAGFRVATLQTFWPELTQCFHNFELQRLARMRSTNAVLRVCANSRKANCVLRGAQIIADEGFRRFKLHLLEDGPDGLLRLPGIGPITKNHLAGNIGLAAVGKNDIWIQRITKAVGAKGFETMLEYLARRTRLSPRAVDLILWQFCAEGGWRDLGYPSFKQYLRNV